VYTVAGIYGLITVAPLYLMERAIATQSPPAITHPEYFYGFIGVTLAWQLLFLRIGRDPVALRAVIPITVVEKLAFGIPALVLFAQHRIAGSTLVFGLIDLVWAELFTMSYSRTDPHR
jgi:hypothetical protein